MKNKILLTLITVLLAICFISCDYLEIKLDNAAPAVVESLTATGYNQKVTLSWSPPSDADFEYTLIIYNYNGLQIKLQEPKGIYKRDILGLKNGEDYTFYLYAVDAWDNKSDVQEITCSPSYSIGSETDDTAPQSTYEILTQGKDEYTGYYPTDVQIKLSATDLESNIRDIYYSVLNNNIIVDEDYVFNNRVITLTENGRNLVTYFAINNAGVKEVSNNVDVLINNNSSQEAFSNFSGIGLDNRVELSWELLADVELDHLEVYYQKNDEIMVENIPSTQITQNIGSLTNGEEYTFSLYAADSDGFRFGRQDTTVSFTNNAPQTILEIPTDLALHGWYNQDIAVTFNATDDDSGVKEIHYSLYKSSNLLRSGTVDNNQSITITERGELVLKYYAVDFVDNQETEKSVPINIDDGNAYIDNIDAYIQASKFYLKDQTILFTVQAEPYGTARINIGPDFSIELPQSPHNPSIYSGSYQVPADALCGMYGVTLEFADMFGNTTPPQVIRSGLNIANSLLVAHHERSGSYLTFRYTFSVLSKDYVLSSGVRSSAYWNQYEQKTFWGSNINSFPIAWQWDFEQNSGKDTEIKSNPAYIRCESDYCKNTSIDDLENDTKTLKVIYDINSDQSSSIGSLSIDFWLKDNDNNIQHKYSIWLNSNYIPPYNEFSANPVDINGEDFNLYFAPDLSEIIFVKTTADLNGEITFNSFPRTFTHEDGLSISKIAITNSIINGKGITVLRNFNVIVE